MGIASKPHSASDMLPPGDLAQTFQSANERSAMSIPSRAERTRESTKVLSSLTRSEPYVLARPAETAGWQLISVVPGGRFERIASRLRTLTLSGQGRP